MICGITLSVEIVLANIHIIGEALGDYKFVDGMYIGDCGTLSAVDQQRSTWYLMLNDEKKLTMLMLKLNL
jgi:hypothetical protein